MNTLLSILIGITIIAGSSYSMLKNAEEVEAVVLDYDAKRKADTDAVMKWRKQVKGEVK